MNFNLNKKLYDVEEGVKFLVNNGKINVQSLKIIMFSSFFIRYFLQILKLFLIFPLCIS